MRLAGSQEGDDVRMLKPRGEADLALEALGAQRCRQLRGEDLDDHVSAQSALERDEHSGHAAPRQLAFDPIFVAQRLLQALTEVLHDA